MSFETVLFENANPKAKQFIRALRPGDRVQWDDRTHALRVLFVDPTGEHMPQSMSEWDNPELAILEGQRGAHFRLNVLNSGRNIRVYRLTNSNWDYGSDSNGQPEEFRVTKRLKRPDDPEKVRETVATGTRLVDDLNPWRYSIVSDPSDAVGDIVVEPWTPGDDVPYPNLDGQEYAIRPDEIAGWNRAGTADDFDV